MAKSIALVMQAEIRNGFSVPYFFPSIKKITGSIEL